MDTATKIRDLVREGRKLGEINYILLTEEDSKRLEDEIGSLRFAQTLYGYPFAIRDTSGVMLKDGTFLTIKDKA